MKENWEHLNPKPALFQNFCVVLCIVCFVSFCVLFVCKYVLYYCHQVATQLQLTNILYHIISNNISYQKQDSKDPDTDASLNQWFCIVIGQGMHVSDQMLKSKSRDFSKKLGHLVFKATHGWLSWWISRHEIKFQKAHGEYNTADLKECHPRCVCYNKGGLICIWYQSNTTIFVMYKICTNYMFRPFLVRPSSGWIHLLEELYYSIIQYNIMNGVV